MEFEWDENKNRANLLKHGVAFEDVLAVFDDPDHIDEGAKNVGGELRFKTTGRAAGIAVLTVIHTWRDAGNEEVIRIISARPASRSERRRYDSDEAR